MKLWAYCPFFIFLLFIQGTLFPHPYLPQRSTSPAISLVNETNYVISIVFAAEIKEPKGFIIQTAHIKLRPRQNIFLKKFDLETTLKSASIHFAHSILEEERVAGKRAFTFQAKKGAQGMPILMIRDEVKSPPPLKKKPIRKKKTPLNEVIPFHGPLITRLRR